MGEFFKGWRRKVGVVTLLLACAFTGLWIRSQFNFDNLSIPFGETVYAYGVTSKGGGIDFYRVFGMEPAGAWNYSSRLAPLDVNGHPKYVTPWEAHLEIEWRWDWAGFIVGAFSALDNTQQLIRTDVFLVPYWFIVCTLTTLSAFLLLPKTRQSTPKKTSEAVPAKQD